MRVKKYTASSMTEAMQQIREELGSEAVILSSKPAYTSGFLGLFRKRNIEVIAAVEPVQQSVSPSVKNKSRKRPEKAIQDRVQKAPEPPEPIKEEHKLLREIEELKGLVKNIQAPAPSHTYPEKLQFMHDRLVDQEVVPEIRLQVMEQLSKRWNASKEEPDASEVHRWFEDVLLGVLADTQNGGPGLEKKYINIVGPTGVGKTTTLAKIAAEAMLKHNKKVAFITTDTYRIAAIDQLKTYAKILNVPIEVAYNLEDFKRAADRFSHYDNVFIDTAGRNFRNPQYVQELGEIINFTDEMETYLVLSLTSKQRDMEDIYQQFQTIPIKQMIFTKADETSTYGALVNFIHSQKLGVAYITNGQDVPDDIEKATASHIVKIIAGVQADE